MRNKGMITLTLLFFFASILSLLFLLNEELLLAYGEIALLQKNYAEQHFSLQKQSNDVATLQSACQRLTLSPEKKVGKIVGKNRGVEQGIFCTYRTLFTQIPKKNLLERQWQYAVREDLLAELNILPQTQPLWLSPKAGIQLYYLDKPHNEIFVQGKVNAIILAKGDLHIQGVGEIRGVVMTQGAVRNLIHQNKGDFVENTRPCTKKSSDMCVERVKLTYDKKASLWAGQLGIWRMLEGSWYDFNKQLLSE